MIYTIKNNKITVLINSFGAELMSIKDINGTQYLWQGEKKYWKDRSPILFPYIARLTDNKYYIDNKCYSMNIHGFASNSEFQVVKLLEDEITFSLKSNETTYKIYPRNFELIITYKLIENKIEITFIVINNDNKTMYFGIGGHPGFLLNGNFEDYYLEFNEKCQPIRVGFNEKCFLNNKDEEFPLIDSKILKLSHNMFDDDAIILYNTSKVISIKNTKTNYTLTVSFKDMKYLGLWHMPKTNAPYICIEPWSSLPSREGIIEVFEKQSNLLVLEKNKQYTRNITTIRIFNARIRKIISNM